MDYWGFDGTPTLFAVIWQEDLKSWKQRGNAVSSVRRKEGGRISKNIFVRVISCNKYVIIVIKNAYSLILETKGQRLR